MGPPRHCPQELTGSQGSRSCLQLQSKMTVLSWHARVRGNLTCTLYRTPWTPLSAPPPLNSAPAFPVPQLHPPNIPSRPAIRTPNYFALSCPPCSQYWVLILYCKVLKSCTDKSQTLFREDGNLRIFHLFKHGINWLFEEKKPNSYSTKAVGQNGVAEINT